MLNHRLRKGPIAALLMSLMLTACGGGEDSPSEQPSPTPQPAENKAPTVSIQGVAEAKEQKEFELIANASDSDGSIASYTWSHDSDLEIAFSNKTAATTEITVPDISEDKSITFTMTVEDDKGASASESVTVTVKRKVSSVTITGIVTDKPIANAIVDVSAAQASEQVTADANGGYSATLVVDESEVDALVKISAKGVGAQEKVTFVSQLNSVAKLVEQAGDDGILSKEENFAVNVTNVTTAEYALLTRNNTIFINDEELSAALLNVDANEKIELAALIKIVVDNDDFELPEGVESTLDLIDDEQTANEFTEQVNETNPTLLEETKEEIKKDTDLVDGAKGELTGSYILQSVKYYNAPAYHIDINDNGAAQITAYDTQAAQWQYEGNVLTITPTEPLTLFKGNSADKGAVTITATSLALTVLGENDVFRTVDIVETRTSTYEDGTVENTEYKATSNLLDKTKTITLSEADLLGDWVLELIDRDNSNGDEPAEKLRFSAGGKLESLEEGDNNEELSWRLADNVLVVNYKDTKEDGSIEEGEASFWFTRSLASGYQFVLKDTSDPRWSDTEYGVLLKIDTNLQVSESDLIGRWTGFIGLQQDLYTMDLFESGELYLDAYDLEHAWFLDGNVMHRQRFIQNDYTVVRKCDVTESNCYLYEDVRHEIIAIENGYIALEREYIRFNNLGEITFSDSSAFVYQYSAEIAQTKLQASMLRTNMEFFIEESEKGNWTPVRIEYFRPNWYPSFIYFGDESYEVTLVDGMLKYSTAEGNKVLELIEYGVSGWVVCIRDENAQCDDSNKLTLHFEQPAIESFYLTDTSLYTSNVYHFEFNAGGTANVWMTPYEQGSQAIAATWTSSDVLTLTPQNRTVRSSREIGTDSNGNPITRDVVVAMLQVATEGEYATVKVTYHTEENGVIVSEETTESRLNKLKLGEMLVDASTQDWTGDWVLSNFDGEDGNNYAGHLTLNENFTGTATVMGSSEVEPFNWAVSNGSLELDFGDEVKVAVELNRDINTGYQYTQFVTEGTNTVSVNGGLMIKKQSITMTEQDYYGRWGYFDGAEHTDYSFAMEIYYDLSVRFGLAGSSIQGRFVDGQFVRSVYYDTSTQEYFRFCTPEQVDCQLYYEFRYTPVATDGSKVFFLRDSYKGDGAQGAIYTSSHIFVKEKMPSMEIAKLEAFHLDNFSMRDESGTNWSSWHPDADGNRLLIINRQNYPFIFNDGVIEVTLDDGFMYFIELVAGSNTKEGVTLCKYLQGDTCLEENHVRLSYYQTH